MSGLRRKLPTEVGWVDPLQSLRRPAAGDRDLLLPLIAGTALGLLSIAAAFATHAGWEDRWLFATRWTARTSAVLFAAAYVWRTVPLRRGLGLAFAAAHLVHAATFITYIAAFDVPRGLFSTIGGTIGYVVLAALVFATFVPMKISVPLRRWGMAYIWLVFMYSYLGRLVEGGDRHGEGLFGVLLMTAVPIIREIQARSGRAAR